MPQNKLQEFVFTTIMAMFMVYGMICYNVALSTGGFTNQTFVMALHEMPSMWPIAIVLELFVVGKLAPMLAFKIVRPTDRPQVITFMISFYICIMMCPIMSLIATVLFKDSPSVGTFIQTWGMNLPVALLWQLCYCGPLVRLIFRTIFKRQLAGSGCVAIQRTSARVIILRFGEFCLKYRQRLGEVLQSVQSIGFKSKVSMSPNVRNGPFQRIYNLRISHAFISHFS